MGRKKKIVVEEGVEPKVPAEPKAEPMDKAESLSQNELDNHPKFAKFKSNLGKG